MNRNYIHDIKPSSRSQRHRDALAREQEIVARKVNRGRSDDDYNDTYYESPSRSSGRGVWYVAALAIIILVFALTFVFAGATVYVTPRQGTVELSGPILAEKEARSGLVFKVMTLEDEQTVSVPAGEKHYVEKKATGKVRFFNSTNSQQKLLIDTRLEAPNGNIYKTKTAVVIPASKIESGKSVPGTVDVEIYADQAGESYNAKDLDFKIFGFKGGPKYNTIYAKSISEITGGFKGETSDVGDEDLKAQESVLKDKLTSTLMQKARAELPEDFILYDKMAVINFGQPVVTSSGEGASANIKEHGTLSAFIFKESDLTKALVGSVVAEADKDKVKIPNIRELNITLDPSSAIGDPKVMQNIRFNIDDSINVVWMIDDEALKNALVGIKKRDFESKMIQFKNIDKAELALKPFWKSNLPPKASAIKIVNSSENIQ